MTTQILVFPAAPGRSGAPEHAQQSPTAASGSQTLLAAFGLSRAAGLLVTWLRRHRARRELASMDAAQLRDTGLDPMAVRRERAKRFWVE